MPSPQTNTAAITITKTTDKFSCVGFLLSEPEESALTVVELYEEFSLEELFVLSEDVGFFEELSLDVSSLVTVSFEAVMLEEFVAEEPFGDDDCGLL